jgi:hypothetical protein
VTAHRRMSPRLTLAACSALLALAGCGGTRAYEQTYLRASYNWTFRGLYPQADRLFNGFDFGHAILSETLLRHPHDGPERLDGPVYRRLTCEVLRDPPRVPIEERAVAPTYGVQYPEAIAVFDWAHMLHRQFYDIIADERLGSAERERRAQEALRYYRSRSDLALSSTPKSMDLMEKQSYSLAFRAAAPRFNGLIWSYHWLQLALYDALLTSPNAAARKAAVARDVERFRRMIADSGRHRPKSMPMSAAVAPAFTSRYPEAAVIFDNLHALHDVVSDVLATPTFSPDEKRSAILLAIARYQNETASSISLDEWLKMSRAMGAVAVDTTGDSRPERWACPDGTLRSTPPAVSRSLRDQ